MNPNVCQQQEVDLQVLLAHLKICSKTRNLKRGKQVHAEAIDRGHDSNLYVGSALINMYAKCGSIDAAHQIFQTIEHPNVVAWNALILGYAENGQSLDALELFKKMRKQGTTPDSITFLAVLKACMLATASIECRDWGKLSHNLVVENECNLDIYVQSTLIDMYAKGGNIVAARQVFDSIKHVDVVSWTVLIFHYAESGQVLTALDMFTRMKNTGFAPNSITFVAALKACTAHEGGECSNWGKALHNLASVHGCDVNIYVQSTLIDMYAKCGNMTEATQVFDSMKNRNAVFWTALILGYADNGEGMTALDLLTKMKREGPALDSVTFVAALKACNALSVTGAECRVRGKSIHNLVVENGWNSNHYVQSTLIDMYAKSGSMVDARHVFENMKYPDIVSWTSLILAYAENGERLAALELVTKLRSVGPSFDSVAISASLKVCASLGALDVGRGIHTEIENGQLNVLLVNCLVDFYAKCGHLAEAQNVFYFHAEKRDLSTWNTLLSGFSGCGDDKSVFKLFEGMQDSGFQPDAVTMLCMLTCCSHAGLVDDGKECFDAMSTKYEVFPGLEHYTCMADIFGRANKLDNAMALMKVMSWSPDEVIWMTILAACHKWKNVKLGRLAFQSLIKLNDKDAAGYVLMGQIYGSRGMLQEQEIVMNMRKAR